MSHDKSSLYYSWIFVRCASRNQTRENRAEISTARLYLLTKFFQFRLFFVMDIALLTKGMRKAHKPLYIILARMCPHKDSALYERIVPVTHTLSRKVALTVVSRLQAQGYTPYDYRVNEVALAAE